MIWNSKAKYYCSTALFAAFTCFIFAPVELYISIKDQVWFSIFEFLPYISAFFLFFIMLFILLGIVISKTSFPLLELEYSCFFWIVVALYIQGNFVRIDYGLLNGHEIEWQNYKAEGVLSILFFLVVICLGLLLFIKVQREHYYSIASLIAICIVLIQVSTLVILGINNDVFDDKERTVATNENEFVFSAKENIVVIILDSFDYRIFDALLAGDQGDYVKNSFEGFTYFSDTVSMYEMTDYSVPQIITGTEYICEGPYSEYVNKVYSDSYLLNKLKEKGYEINIYPAIELPEESVGINNWKRIKSSASSHKKLLGYLYRLIGFRYMPQQLKQLFWFYPDDMNDIQKIDYAEKEDDSKGVDIYSWGNDVFFDSLNTNGFVVNDNEGCFHMYHLKGTHPKRNCRRDFVEVKEEISFEETALGLIDMLNLFFEKLKDSNLYDDMSIIVMADHGDTEYLNDELSNLPIFLYKKPNEHHELRENKTPFSYRDLNGIYAEMLGDDEYKKNEEPSRYIYKIIWTDHITDANNHVAGFEIVDVNGDSEDRDNYTKTSDRYYIDE